MTTEPQRPPWRSLAWNGVAFAVPANWELTVYRFPGHGVSRIELEDEYSVRAELEWTWPATAADLDALRARHDRAIQRFVVHADHREPVGSLPDGWLATAHRFREGVLTKEATGPVHPIQWLLTAFYAQPAPAFFASVILHFNPEDQDDPPAVLRHLARSFVLHPGPLVPWQLFDIRCETPREFALESTLFDVGLKLLIFRWRLRRFYLWHFSLADRLLQDGATPAEWFSGYLNSFRYIYGQRFFPAADGEITHRRRRWHLFGHRDEIARWCFRWKGRCRLDPEKNHLVGWIYSYRRLADLELIPPSLRFGRDLFAPDSPPDPRWLDKKRARQRGGA